MKQRTTCVTCCKEYFVEVDEPCFIDGECPECDAKRKLDSKQKETVQKKERQTE